MDTFKESRLSGGAKVFLYRIGMLGMFSCVMFCIFYYVLLTPRREPRLFYTRLVLYVWYCGVGTFGIVGACTLNLPIPRSLKMAFCRKHCQTHTRWSRVAESLLENGRDSRRSPETADPPSSWNVFRCESPPCRMRLEDVGSKTKTVL